MILIKRSKSELCNEVKVTKTRRSTRRNKLNPSYSNAEELLPVLKKFRPPPSRQQLRELAAAAKNQENNSVLVNNVAEKSQSLISLSIDAELQPQTIYKCSNNFHSMNAWLAKKRPDWCSKEEKTITTMLTKDRLIATYKCMGRQCSYTTISIKFFKKHLNFHANSILSTEQIFFCPYCLFQGESQDSLINHYEIHAYDKFQCGYCFYRSVSQDTCNEHLKDYHSLKPPIIYECPLLESSPNDKTSGLKEQQEKNVHLLHCSICRIEFYSQKAYELHIEGHAASSDDEVKRQAASDLKAYEEKIKQNLTGFYDCIFCKYASNFRAEIRSHMQEHPSERLFICQREAANPEIDYSKAKSITITQLVSEKYVEVEKFNSDLNELRNFKNVEIICDP